MLCDYKSLAFEDFDVLGIMYVSGNKSLTIVSPNTLRIIDFENRNIPVTKGAKASLKRLKANEEQENISAECHGSDGLGESGLLLERIARPYIHHYYNLNNVIGVIIHDMYCMLSIIDPSIITKQEQLTIEIPNEGEYRGATKVCTNGKPITAILGFDELKLKRLFLDLMMPDKQELIDKYFPQL